MDINEENWKDIKDFEELYQISDHGNVMSKITNNKLKFTKAASGYLRVILFKNGKKNSHLIHRLVALHFLDNPENYNSIIHLDDNKANNSMSNIIWISRTNLRKKNKIEKIKTFDLNKIESLPDEKWKSITGYEKYIISSKARILNKETNRFLKFHVNGGYSTVKLSNTTKSKSYMVHRLVAQEFVNNSDPKTKIYVDHIDNNKLNNKSSNLRWVTPKENTNYYLDNHREENGKTVLQYKGNKLIKIWNCTNEILREYPHYNESTLRKRILGNREYKGFRWNYSSTKSPFKKIDGEKFKNAGIIDDFNCSNYEISNYGRIRNISRNTINKQKSELNGYYSITIANAGKKKNFNVHYLVATLFVPGKTKEKCYINHIDEDKSNCRADNLEWCTIKENTTHSMGMKVHKIDPGTGEVLKTFDSIRDATRHMQPTRKSIYTEGIANCCHNRQSTYAGFKWQFADDIPHPEIPENAEIWKPIKHYPSYEISNTGKARNTATKKELHQSSLKDGRRMISLSKNGMRRKYAIHILVAKHFLKDFDDDYVFHIDGDKSNNTSTNLKIETRKNAKAKVELKKNPKISTLKGEIWKNIKDFPSYKISNNSRVQNKKTGRILKQTKKTAKNGSYMVVMLRKESGKETTAMMHRLVAQAFIKNPDEYEYIQHIDGDRCNNNLNNIKWVDRDEIYG